MIKIGNKMYYIDFDSIQKLIAGGEEFQTPEQKEVDEEKYYETNPKTNKEEVFSRTVTERTYNRERQYDVAKYDILSMMLQVVMNNQDDMDEMLGVENGLMKQPIPFKIAFNTLLFYNVLKDLGI